MHPPYCVRGYRPSLEKLEDRTQPGSLLSEAAGWSLLGQHFAALNFESERPTTFLPETAGADKEPARRAAPPVSLPEQTRHRQADFQGTVVRAPAEDKD